MAKKDINKDKNSNFFKDLKSELKKVTWPTFKKLVNNTSAVISIVLIVAIIVFVLDLCFENLNKLGVERIKSLVLSDEEVVESEDTTDSEVTTDLGDGIDLTTEETTTDSDEEISEIDSDLETVTEEVTE